MKRILATVMAGAMAIGMAACDAKAPAESSAVETTTAETTTTSATEAETEAPSESVPGEVSGKDGSTAIVDYDQDESTAAALPEDFSEFDFCGISVSKLPDYEGPHGEYVNTVGKSEADPAVKEDDLTVKFAYSGKIGDLSVKKVSFKDGKSNEVDISDKCSLTKDENSADGYVFSIAPGALSSVPVGNQVTLRIGVGESSFMDLSFIVAG